MGLTFSLDGIIDIDAEFSYVAKINEGWLPFEYNSRTAMEQWAEETGIKMRLLTRKAWEELPSYAFRTDADRMMFILAWSGDDS